MHFPVIFRGFQNAFVLFRLDFKLMLCLGKRLHFFYVLMGKEKNPETYKVNDKYSKHQGKIEKQGHGVKNVHIIDGNQPAAQQKKEKNRQQGQIAAFPPVQFVGDGEIAALQQKQQKRKYDGRQDSQGKQRGSIIGKPVTKILLFPGFQYGIQRGHSQGGRHGEGKNKQFFLPDFPHQVPV